MKFVVAERSKINNSDGKKATHNPPKIKLLAPQLMEKEVQSFNEIYHCMVYKLQLKILFSIFRYTIHMTTYKEIDFIKY